MKITKRLLKKIEQSPKVYLVACWAKWGIQEYRWTGEWFTSTSGLPIPIVYYYNDYNGTYEEYQKIPIIFTTTGICADWSFYKQMAQNLADKLNELEFGESNQYKA